VKLLIVNQPGRNVLASIRSMGKSDYSIDIDIAYQKSKNLKDVLLKSKYINRVFFTINPVNNYLLFKDQIMNLIIKYEYDFILPYGVKTTVALSKFRDEIISKKCIIPIPKFETLIVAHDKEFCLRHTQNIGLSIPKTYFHKDIESLFLQKIEYPVIVKARRNSGIHPGFEIAYSETDLWIKYQKIDSIKTNSFIIDFQRPVVQEFIDGDVYDANFFIVDGKVLAFTFQQRVKCIEGNIGAGIINKTLNDRLKDSAFDFGRKLLQSLNWIGSCMVELILDRKSGEFKLIEINPKLWGTLELSIRAGVDFPLAMIKYFCFKEEVKLLNYKEISFYWIWDIIRDNINNNKKTSIKKTLQLIKNENNEIHTDDIKPEIGRFFRILKKWLKKKCIFRFIDE